MTDEERREKIIEGLEYAWNYIRERPNKTATPQAMAMTKIKNAIEFLQETAEIDIEGGGSTWWHACTECRESVDSRDKYCRHCGRRFI